MVVGPYPVRTVYTKSRLSRKQFVSRNTGLLDGLPTNTKEQYTTSWPWQIATERTRTNTNPNDTEANAAGRSVRASQNRKEDSV